MILCLTSNREKTARAVTNEEIKMLDFGIDVKKNCRDISRKQ